jgi:hypothetical protein
MAGNFVSPTLTPIFKGSRASGDRSDPERTLASILHNFVYEKSMPCLNDLQRKKCQKHDEVTRIDRMFRIRHMDGFICLV